MLKKIRPYIVIFIVILAIGGTALFYGNSSVSVRAVSGVVIDVPSYIEDRAAAREYLGFLLSQYIADSSLPDAVASDLSIVLPENTMTVNIEREESTIGTYKISLSGRGYDISGRLLKSIIIRCQKNLDREAKKLAKQIVKEKETELSFLRKYVEKEKKLLKKRFSTVARYEKLMLDVAAMHLKLAEFSSVLRFTEPAIAILPSSDDSNSFLILIIIIMAVVLLLVEFVLKSGLRQKIQWEIERDSKLSVIGSIPELTSVLECRESPMGLATEAFAALKGRLEFGDFKKLAFVSWGEGEGTSTVCANLALKCSSFSKVTLIDGNMRKPSVHSIFDISNDIGLSDVLIDTEPVDVEWVAPDFDLKLIVSGPVPPDAGDLLNSSRISVLENYVKVQGGGCVFIDLPPISVSSDLFAFSSMFDAIIFVVNPGMYPSKMVVSGISMLQKCEIPIAGIVMNNVDTAMKSRQSYLHH